MFEENKQGRKIMIKPCVIEKEEEFVSIWGYELYKVTFEDEDLDISNALVK